MSHSSVEESPLPGALTARALDSRRPLSGRGSPALVSALSGETGLLVAIAAAAAALRFSTLTLQSFSSDESFTVHLTRVSFGAMLAQLPRTESTPPLHYVLAWLWGQVFGTGEAGLRSLSAVCGVLTVPVMFALGRAAYSKRAGLIAAALCACNPILVWYSQEARSYALLVLLSAGSLYFCVRAVREPRPRLLAGWAIAAALSLATHYFALFVVLPEAAWLLGAALPRRRALLACVLPAAVAIAEAPLAYAQRHPAAGWSQKWTIPAVDPLGHRILQLPRELLFGFKEPLGVPASILLGLLGLYAVSALWRRGSPELRRRSCAIAAIAAVGFAVPVAAALISPSLDLVETRFFLGAWVPVLLLIAGGLALARAGRASTCAFCAISLVAVVAVFADPLYQRPDVRGAVRALGRPSVSRMVLLTGAPTLLGQVYLPGSIPAFGSRRVGEIDVVAMPTAGRTSPPPVGGVGSPQPGFVLRARRVAAHFTILRFLASAPRTVAAADLSPYRWRGWTPADLGPGPQAGVLLQRAEARRSR